MEQELLILPEHLSSPPVSVRFVLFPPFYVMCCRSLFVLLWFTSCDYPFDLRLVNPLWFTSCDYPFDLRLVVTPLIYVLWLPIWFTSCDYPFNLRLVITPLIYVLWLPLWFTSCDYPFDLRLVIAPLIYVLWLPLCYLQTFLMSILI